MDRRTDAQLIAASRSDDEAFRELYDRYAWLLHRFFARRTRSDQAALELTAETFAQAWLSRTRFRDLAGGTAGPWLFAIARRVLVRSVRRERIDRDGRERLRVEAGADAPPPEPRWLDGLDADLETALAELPGGHREAVELRVLADLSYAQIAARLGCSPVAARIRVSRSLAWLRTRLEGGAA
jgi:RNA polymerase sigma-70 factor (ECF subfamily)